MSKQTPPRKMQRGINDTARPEDKSPIVEVLKQLGNPIVTKEYLEHEQLKRLLHDK